MATGCAQRGHLDMKKEVYNECLLSALGGAETGI